jgi:hypothetical protein
MTFPKTGNRCAPEEEVFPAPNVASVLLFRGIIKVQYIDFTRIQKL